jgi:hypothetical protein
MFFKLISLLFEGGLTRADWILGPVCWTIKRSSIIPAFPLAAGVDFWGFTPPWRVGENEEAAK